MPLDLTDGSAKHRSVAGQRPFEASNCPLTQEAIAPWTHVVSPSEHKKKDNLNSLLRYRFGGSAYWCKNL